MSGVTVSLRPTQAVSCAKGRHGDGLSLWALPHGAAQQLLVLAGLVPHRLVPPRTRGPGGPGPHAWAGGLAAAASGRGCRADLPAPVERRRASGLSARARA